MRAVLIGLAAIVTFLVVGAATYIVGFLVFASIVGWGQGLEGQAAVTGNAIVALSALAAGSAAAFLVARLIARRR